VWERIGLTGAVGDQRLDATGWGAYPGGAAIGKGQPLFPRKSI
jgi:hypothetical protein